MNQEEIDRLQSTIDHLMRCKEFESNLQREILDVGSKYMNVKDGVTYSVTDAWSAIKDELEESEQCGICGDYDCNNPRACETGDGE